MSINRFRGAVEWALMVALVAGSGLMAQAKDEQTSPGRVVRIGPEDQASLPALPAPTEGDDLQAGRPDTGRHIEMPKYWIGLLGGPVSPELRAYLDIPEDQGVMIREVVPESPAAKAGLKKYDIVLRANDTLLKDMRDMVEIVRTEGEKHGQIALEVLLKGGRETVTVTPEDRPERLASTPGFGGGGAIAGQEIPPGALQFFRNFGGDGGEEGALGQQFEEGAPFEFRNFGPGVVIQPGPGGAASMPSGVAVSIEKQEGQPAHITVKRGGESWEVVGDDEKSLEKLPADLRPFVTGLLHGQGPMNSHMPHFGGRMGGGMGRLDDEGLRKRLEAMEQQMQELQNRLLGPTNPPTDKTK